MVSISSPGNSSDHTMELLSANGKRPLTGCHCASLGLVDSISWCAAETPYSSFSLPDKILCQPLPTLPPTRQWSSRHLHPVRAAAHRCPGACYPCPDPRLGVKGWDAGACFDTCHFTSNRSRSFSRFRSG